MFKVCVAVSTTECGSFTCTLLTGVQSVACREGNTVCSKIGAGLILGELLGLEMKPDWLPAQPQVHLGLNTVVEASIVPHIYGIQIE